MSRRKQARPRHLDDELEPSPTVTENDNVFAVKSTLPESLKLPTSCEEDPVTESIDDLPVKSSDDISTSSDAHVCGKCRAEFLELTEFIAHKAECSKEKVMVLYDQNQTGSEDQSELCNINGVCSRLSEDQEIDNLEGNSHNSGSDGEQNFDNLGKGEDEVDAALGVGEENQDLESESAYNDMEEDELKSLANDNDENNDNENDDDLDSLKEGELEDDLKSGQNSDIPPYMLPLAHLNAMHGGNVMLEPLQATKAAVAQFAENNLNREDGNALQEALFNLQQQQIMQLQLIHQLQQQLVANGGQNGQLPSALLNGRLNLAQLASMGINLPFSGLEGKNEERSKSPDPEDEIERDSETESLAEESVKESSVPNSKPSLPAMPPLTSDQSESLDLSSKTSTEGPGNSPAVSAPAERTSVSDMPQDVRSTSALDFSRTAKVQEDQQYVGDDPFFKHKCRLCQKVFGSDSALQIHIRSHTDAPPPPTDPWMVPNLSSSRFWTWEKPFKCNICGGRFSTRGNLKVHFQRHKAEFPDVEMNPNPVPEHLDKTPNPFLASPFPTAALNPFAAPMGGFMGLPGLMNGLMFPSPHLAPRLPFGHPHIPPRPPQVPEEKRPSSPQLGSSSSLYQMKKETSPTQSSEAPKYSSPNVKESAKIPTTAFPPLSHPTISSHYSNPTPALPMSSIPLMSNYPAMSSLPSRPPFSAPRPPSLPPTSVHNADPLRTSILPANILDNDDNLEQFMEIDKSETCKLQQLVDNIEHKLTDPNQCVICHRILSCKSALQMHYRIHTGERPFKCKICGRSFTTKGNLKTHMGVHRAKPPLRMMHQCPVCHKQFTNLLVLQQHIRSHTGMSNLPAIPNLTHLGMFGRHPMDMDPALNKPLNMSRPYPDYEKELDLSNKRPRLETDESKDNDKRDNLDDSMESLENDAFAASDDEQNEMDRIDEEANKLAARDAGNEREFDEAKLKYDTKYESSVKEETPKQSDDNAFNPRPPTPKYLQEAPSPSSESQNGKFNSYSTSLAALEERVRAIDSTMARNPLSQFHAAPFLLGPSTDGITNGKRSMSPRSDSESEMNEKDGLKPSTPALSVSSEGSMGSNFMLGALDLRSQDINNKNGTTCNVCYKTFACRSALDIHYRSHTKERPFKCDFCDRSFTTRGNMKQHMLTHKIRESNESDSGGERNNNNTCTPNQNDHNSDSSNDSSQFEKSFKKDTDESFNSDKDKSSPEHNQNTSFSMSQGLNSRSSSVSSNLVTGNNTASSPEQSSVINKPTTNTNGHLSSSSSSHHTSHGTSHSSPEQSPFLTKTVKHQCLVCQKGFSSASALQIHIRTHTGDKPFKCNVCAKAFTTKGNLKVHMGTHMWNNSPSRRGRRMSIEPPFMMTHKENPYLPHGFPPRPEFYPFQFPPFMNGLPTPPKSIGDVSVIPGLNNGLHSNNKPELTSPRNDIVNHKAESPESSDDGQKYTENGELDLSMKSIGSAGSRDSAKTSPSSLGSSPTSGILSPSQSSSLGWGWKASCHFCSSTFPSPMSLEYHIRTMHKESFHKIVAS